VSTKSIRIDTAKHGVPVIIDGHRFALHKVDPVMFAELKTLHTRYTEFAARELEESEWESAATELAVLAEQSIDALLGEGATEKVFGKRRPVEVMFAVLEKLAEGISR